EPVLTTPSNDDTDVECTIKSSDHLNELQLLDAENASLVFVSWDYAKKACKKDKSVTCQSRCRQNQDGTIALELDLAVVGEKESRTINCSAHFFKDGQSGVLSSSLTVSGRAKGEPRKNTCDESYEDGRKDGLSGALEWALPVMMGLLLIVLLIVLVLLYKRCNRTTDDIGLGITEGNSPLAQSNHTQSTPSVQLKGPTQDTTGSGCAEGGCSAPGDLPTPNTVRRDVSVRNPPPTPNDEGPTSSAKSTDSASLGLNMRNSENVELEELLRQH
ncbi:hypothetical protein BaRGS_00013570, partial [Batillaria attramentaria]